MIAEPEITEYDIIDEDAWLVIASDGIWEMLTSQETADLVHGLGSDPDPQDVAECISDNSRCAIARDTATPNRNPDAAIPMQLFGAHRDQTRNGVPQLSPSTAPDPALAPPTSNTGETRGALLTRESGSGELVRLPRAMAANGGKRRRATTGMTSLWSYSSFRGSEATKQKPEPGCGLRLARHPPIDNFFRAIGAQPHPLAVDVKSGHGRADTSGEHT